MKSITTIHRPSILKKDPFRFLFFCHVFITLSFAGAAQEQSNEGAKKSASKYGTSFTTRGITGFVIYTDQDIFNLVGPNRDANYTMGTKLHWTGPGTDSRILGLPYILSGIDQVLFKMNNGLLSDDSLNQLDKYRSSFSFGVSAFTPENLELSTPDTTDRPYSSTLFFQSGRVYGSVSSRWMLETNLIIDILGLRIAEFVQTGIHSGQRISDPDARPNPMGWSNQVSDGFGLSASYEAMAYWSLIDSETINKWVTPYVGFGGSLGTYTRARGTLGLVIGRAPNTQSQSIPGFFGLAIGRAEKFLVSEDGESVNYNSKKADKSDVNFFIHAQMYGNLWAYNALLQGLPWEDDPYTLDSDEIERATILWSVNANLIFRTTFLRFGFSGRTKEFKKSGALPHGWGTLAIGWML